MTQPAPIPASNTIDQRIAVLENNVTSLVATYNQIVGTHLPAIRDKLLALEAAISGAIAPKLETTATEIVTDIGARVAAIENWLTKTPQAHGALFNTTSPPQSAGPAPKPV
jgi:hypothetical protein